MMKEVQVAGSLQFYQLAIGAEFSVRGQRYRKTGMAAAEDQRGFGYTVPGLVLVESVGEPRLLPPGEAERWKPRYGAWQELMERDYWGLNGSVGRGA